MPNKYLISNNTFALSRSRLRSSTDSRSYSPRGRGIGEGSELHSLTQNLNLAPPSARKLLPPTLEFASCQLEHATWRRPLQISFISGQDKAIHGVTHSKANFPTRLEFVGRRHSGIISLYLVRRPRQVGTSHAFMRGTPVSGDRFDIHRHITDQIITMLDGATSDFHLPWQGAARDIVRPINVASRNAYRGVNILSLWAAAIEKGYSSGVWGTFKQWSEIGAQVRRGEKAAYIVFYKQVIAGAKETDDDGKASGARFIARGTPVFAAEQVDGWAAPSQPMSPASVMTPIEQAETFVAATGAKITHGGNRAFYRPATDSIHLPLREAFIGTATSSATEGYYATLLHELTHWTSHPDRCNRELGRRFGDSAYGMEELVAELGAAFLCADLQITHAPRPDHAHYLASWLAVLRQDKRAIFTAASKASEAAAFLNTFTTTALSTETKVSDEKLL